MKLIKHLLVALLIPAISFAQPYSEQEEQDRLIGLGMTTELAVELTDYINGGGIISILLPNDVYLKARNAADTADLDLVKADSTDDTVVNADTGDIIKLSVAGTAVINISSAGLLPAVDGNNSTSNLGSSTFGFKNVYLSDATNDVQLFVSNGFYTSFPTGQSMFFREASTDRWSIRATSGDFAASSSGNTVALQEATAGSACMGTLTANGGTPVVTSTTCATTGSRIFLTRTSAETGVVSAWISAISTGVSFSITGEAGDTGTYNWIIFHEAP